MRWRILEGDVVVSVQGGLGNQLFEWAFGTALAAEGRSVLFDTVRCRGRRPLSIGPLMPPGSKLAAPIGYALAAAEHSGLLGAGLFPQPVREKGFGHDATLVGQIGSRSYLLGYFQSPKYFSAVESDVRQQVTQYLGGMLTPAGVEFAASMAEDPHSIAVHVRRGDYVTHAQAANHHGTLRGGYYEQALQLLAGKGHGRRIWFSDDPDWVRANLSGPKDTICSPEMTTSAGGEIALMAACSSRVIANSSFSWWAGWLGRPATPENPVIAPSRWFAAEPAADVSDLVPAQWARV